MALDRSAFLKALPLDREAVELPALGGTAHVRMMSAAERDRFEMEHAQDPGKDFRARIAVATVCDEAGALLFKPADVPALSALPYTALDPIVEVATRLSKIGAGDVAELEKNS